MSAVENKKAIDLLLHDEKYSDMLSIWEIIFLDNIRHKADRLSPNQHAKLDEIWKRVTEGYMVIPKPKRYVSKAYLEFINEQPCLICGKQAEPHHWQSRGAGGSDLLTIPLCRDDHSRLETIGWTKFQEMYILPDNWATQNISKLLSSYIENLEQNGQEQDDRRPSDYSLTVRGVCYPKGNSRQVVSQKGRLRVIKGEGARQFVQDFLKQVTKKPKTPLPGDIILRVRVYYPNRRFDLDTSLVRDCLQQAGIIGNDRQIVRVLEEKKIDRKRPRVKIELWEEKEKSSPVHGEGLT